MSSRQSRAPSQAEHKEEMDAPEVDDDEAVASSSAASPSRPQTAASSNGVDQSIQVLCRFRPENAREIEEAGHTSDLVEFDTLSQRSDPSSVGEGVHLNLDGGKRSASYRFDRVFQPHATQEDVFDSIGAPTVKSVLEGYNSCILAYGQTGSGKTHSMMGPGFDGRALGEAASSSSAAVTGEPGLIPRVMASLFSQISALESDTIEFQMRACYVEVYKENVRDLLNPIDDGPNRRTKLSLEIRQDTHRGMLLPDATEVPLHSLQDVYAVLKLGNKHRKVASTKANDVSSRSHAILLVTLQRSNLITHVQKTSQLYLVDLAGSEKVSKTEVTGVNLAEAQKINAGLLALGQVIQALVAQSQAPRKQIYVPYRNSKLTRLLSNCVGGNSRTSLLINCSPSIFNLQETISTLRFGSAMKQIKNHATVNVEIGMAELKALYRASQEENEKLKAQIKAMQSEMRLMHEVQRFETMRSESAAVEEAARARRAAEEDEEFERQQQMQQVQRQQQQQLQQQTPRIQPRATPALSSPQAVFMPTRPASAAAGASADFSESPEAPNSASISAASSSASSSSSQRVSSPSSGLDFNGSDSDASALESSPEPASARALKDPEEHKQAEHDDQAYDQSTDSMEPAEPVDMRAALQAETIAESNAPGSHLLQSIRSPAQPSLLSRSTAGDLRQLLLHFLCPLSKKLMRDPVIALDGHCYERRAIATYLLNHSTSPVSGQSLSSKLLIPNLGLQTQIRKFYPQSLQAANKSAASKSFLSVSSTDADGMDVSYLSCLPLAVLGYLSEFSDARTLCRFGQTSHEHASVSAENRLWKLLVLRKGWPLDMGLVREVGSSVKTYYKTVWKQRQPLSNKRREASAAFMKQGVYLVPTPQGGVAAVNLHLN